MPSDENIKMILSLLSLVVPIIMTWLFKDKRDKAERNLTLGIELAYNIVNEISMRTGNKVDDKVAMGLDYLRQYLGTSGQTLKPADEEKAKLLFQAMHGAEKAAK